MSSSSKKFCSSEEIEKRNSETTINEKKEMQKYKKRILQCIQAEKITSTELKYWPCFHQLKSEFISQIHMVMVMVYGNQGHAAVIVTKDKNVYSLCYNTDNCSKTSDIHIAPDLKKIEVLCGKNIKTFTRGSYFALALTEEGEVYFLSSGKQIFTEELPIKPIRVSGFSNKRIVDIACGDFYFLVLTNDGEVYAWEGKIYIDTIIDPFNGIVRQVKHGLEKKNVVHIASGDTFNIVITDENTIYGWSSNRDGQNSIQRQIYYKYPREIITFSDKIVKVVCGYMHTLALTNKGKIFAWGDNYYRQLGLKNYSKSSGPIMVNVPEMGKVLNVDAYGNMSIAVGYDRTIYVWGNYFNQKITQPFPTKFSRIFDVLTHTMWIRMHKPLIVHDSVHTEEITNYYNYKYTEEILNILESLGAAFDDPLTSDFTIQVEGQSIYVHKIILNIRCQYFRNMFHYDWVEDVQSTSDSSPVYIVSDSTSDKFSYVVYRAFLKYLYTGIIDLPAENILELVELADMYCVANLIKDSSEIIKQTIAASNVVFLYNMAIKYNAKELKEYCLQFALRYMRDDTLSEDYVELDMSTKTKIVHRELIQNDVIITSSTFHSPNKNVEKRNSKTTIEENMMQKYAKRNLLCVLMEKITPIDLKYWLFFHMLKPEFIAQIHMVLVYDKRGNAVIIVMKDKNVYNFHYKRKHLKTGDQRTILKKIKELCGKSIKAFAHSCTFILALTEEGEVYFSEKDKPYRKQILCISTFIRIADLSDKRIVDIRCGRHQGLALTSDGEVYTWKEYCWQNKVSTHSEFDNEGTAYFNVPSQVKHKLEKKKVVHIACGDKFHIVVTDENTIYGWGCNGKHQISLVPEIYYKYPQEITTFRKKISDKIVKVVCGKSHTLALTSKGDVYAWGNNYYGQVGVNSNRKPCDPTVVNVSPDMGKVLDIAAYDDFSVAVGTDKIIYVWGRFYNNSYTTIPFPTKFSNIHDVPVYSLQTTMLKPFIVFTNNLNNFNVKEILNILESLGAVFDVAWTSDLTIRVEGYPIYVHKAILKIRCQYFRNMFQHDWMENIQSISDSVYIVSDKFSYVVYRAFLKYLYTGIIDLPSENALELLELADMYCVTNLIKDANKIIKETITVSNVAFVYNKAIECKAKELEEFCFYFALRHMKAVVLSDEYIKLDMNIKDNFIRRAAEENAFKR